jgi:hypothetical protein
MGDGTEDHDGIYDQAVIRLDALVMPAVKDRDLTAPPGGESDGDAYIVGASATGDWSGKDGEIAHYFTGWLFTPPKDGFRLWVEDENAIIAYDGTNWRTLEALVTVADDAAVSYDAPDTFGVVTIVTDDIDGVGVVYFETVGASVLKLAGATNTEVATGVLSGTTGADAKLTISAHTDGKIYIENRLGASAEVRLSFLGSP